ncbi:isochorismatase family protein [Lichenifustis flavocetrariae]|uniref:Isochorismatase family protein n=1 Tax=Lichenifustis flavocetrariae TaxID=2949735 RepID=A0AA41YZK7_9HYPH|nr:isochorismatase family protein [Lichenifustis flavocetrariae]MCW6510170.1 isochorismatase family protein [Lichenifustis flavocetrariae]
MTSDDWQDMLSENDREVMRRGKWAQTAGFGKRPALIIVDAQNYMTGIRGADDNKEKFPLACGEVGFTAVDRMVALQAAARRNGVPVFQTRFIVNPDADDCGMFHRKVGAGIGRGDNLYFGGTFGAEIVEPLRPLKGEIVLDKKKKSAFFGTPLLSLLIDKQIDTCIITGGSTSNCVRATAIDSEQHNFFTIIPEEAVFDRIEICHRVSLFDMNRFCGDVLPCDAVLAYLDRIGAAARDGRS